MIGFELYIAISSWQVKWLLGLGPDSIKSIQCGKIWPRNLGEMLLESK